ncbi:MAG: phytanoyl-CoA dioxygenase family protein [Candidatus Binatia bacterium]|nr:phytanoyl-CoA dioxygenase family protein [Candidatus Binatia bacterium]
MSTPAILTDEQIETFRRDGFLVVDDVFSEAERATFGTAVDAAVAGRASVDTRSLDEKTIYEQSFIQCINLWEDNVDVRPLTFDARIGEMATRLLDADAVRIWHDQALYKEGGGRETDAHQDRPFWPIEPANQVTAWIPFDGSRRGRGAMAYVPGSHRAGLERFCDISHLFQEPYDILNDPAIADIEPVWVEVDPGSVVFHHSLTVHFAEPNTDTSTRRVYCVIYFADGCLRRSAVPHIVPDRQKIEVGQPIAGDVSPIVWPRRSNDLPPTPTSGRPPRLGYS